MIPNDAVALVAGASGDIGRAIAFDLLEAGADVVMTGRSLERLRQVRPPTDLADKCHHLAADLTRDEDIERLAASPALRRRLDVLVLSSGAYERSHDRSVFDRQLAANVSGPYALLRRLLPLLIEAKGQVVFINSSQALKASAEVAQYAATKHALKAIADSLRDEVNPDGVRVMSIYLGRTAGERQRAIFASEGRPYAPDRLIEPSEIARLVGFMLRLSRSAEVTDVTLRPMQKL
jgi:NAD(P)-dependent dehydrogenase (short-subunit alcohol dehydrogenase family)